MAYCTRDDVRKEGVTTALISNTRLNAILDLVSSYIDEFTGQWFEPRQITVLKDGRGHRTLYFDVPVIDVTSIKRVDNQGNVQYTFADSEYVVYNRHVRLNMLDPDDRLNPKIERAFPADPWIVRLQEESVWSGDAGFFRGQQNVQVEGWFGYTDYDASDPHGVTPPLIARVCCLLALREIWPRYSDADESEDARNRGRIKSEKTRDQSYTLGGVAGSLQDNLAGGRLTGDPEIDSILLQYRRSIGIATV